MNFTVSTLCKSGKSLNPNTLGKTATGNVTTYYTGATRYAQITDENGSHLLHALECVSVDMICSDGMMLSGYEIARSNNRHMQQWWCRTVAIKEGK